MPLIECNRHCNGSIGNQYDCKRVHFRPITGSCPLFHANMDTSSDMRIVNACVHQQPPCYEENSQDNLTILTNPIHLPPPPEMNQIQRDTHQSDPPVNQCPSNGNYNGNIILNNMHDSNKHITLNLLAECSPNGEQLCDCGTMNDDSIEVFKGDNVFPNKQAISCDCKPSNDQVVISNGQKSVYQYPSDCSLCKFTPKNDLNQLESDAMIYCDGSSCRRKSATLAAKLQDNEVTYLPFIILVIILTISTSFLIVASVLYIKCKLISHIHQRFQAFLTRELRLVIREVSSDYLSFCFTRT